MNILYYLTHFTFEALGFLAAAIVYKKNLATRKDVLSSDQRWWVLFGGAIGAILGSKLLAYFEHASVAQTWTLALFTLVSSKTIVGALLGGLIGVEWTKKIKSIKTHSGDQFVFPIIVGLLVGRMGCLIAGERDGILGYYIGQTDTRHPVIFYEQVFLLFLLFLFKSQQHRRLKTNGLMFKFFLSSYLSFRFVIEFIKIRQPIVISLSAIQVACLMGMIYYLIVFGELIWKEKK